VVTVFSAASGIERLGNDAGIASLFGIALLSLICFTQAREIRRLREHSDQLSARGPQVSEAPGPGAPRREQRRTAAPAASRRLRLPAHGALPARRRVRVLGGVAGLAIGLVVIAVLVVGPLSRGAGRQSNSPVPRASQAPGRRSRASPAAITPSAVTVAVLNATTTVGLASQVLTQLRAAGFRGGPTANAPAPLSMTAIAYTDGQRDAALQVAHTLAVPASSVVAIDDVTRSAVGPGAQVVVSVGADRNGP